MGLLQKHDASQCNISKLPLEPHERRIPCEMNTFVFESQLTTNTYARAPTDFTEGSRPFNEAGRGRIG